MKRYMSMSTKIVLILMSLLVVACSSPAPKVLAPMGDQKAYSLEPYKIGVGDAIQIAV